MNANITLSVPGMKLFACYSLLLIKVLDVYTIYYI